MPTTDEPIVLDPSVFPDTSLLITEDGKPVDNLFVEKQYRLLTEPLWASWKAPDGLPFLVTANVGLFYQYKKPPLVPDVMLATAFEQELVEGESDSRSYFMWIVGKPPDVVIEIVSDRRGREDSKKLREYQRIRVPYYVVFDPDEILKDGILRVFDLNPPRPRKIKPGSLGELGLGLTLWEGMHEGLESTWLRWVNTEGTLIPTGKEQAEAEKARVKIEKARAKLEKTRADSEKERAETATQRVAQLETRVRLLEDRLRAAGMSTNGAAKSPP